MAKRLLLVATWVGVAVITIGIYTFFYSHPGM